MLIFSCRRNKTCPDRILSDIDTKGFELLRRRHLYLVVPALPNVHFAFQKERESPFDELHGLFQRNIVRRSQKQMNVIGHDDEGVQLKSAFAALGLQVVQHQVRRVRDLKDAAALCGNES